MGAERDRLPHDARVVGQLAELVDHAREQRRGASVIVDHVLRLAAHCVDARTHAVDAGKPRLRIVEIAGDLAAREILGEALRPRLPGRDGLVDGRTLVAQRIDVGLRGLRVVEPHGRAALLLQLVHQRGDSRHLGGDLGDLVGLGVFGVLLQQRLAGEAGEGEQRQQAGDRDPDRNSNVIEPRHFSPRTPWSLIHFN